MGSMHTKVVPGLNPAPAGIPSSIDILLVGLGPVGAVIAILLGRQGVRALAIDKSPDIFLAPRAIALDNEALRVLQMAGVDESELDMIAIPHVRLRSRLMGEFGRINTLGGIDGHPKLVTFYQPDLERLLRRRLADHPSLRCALGVSLLDLAPSPDVVTARLRLPDGTEATIAARYVIGADGANSHVRHLIGQQFKGRSFAEDWLIVDACNRTAPIDHVEFNCDYRRPIPHMIAPGGRERWEFKLRRGEHRAEMESDGRIAGLLAPWGGLATSDIERRAVYRFHARTAKSFNQGRIFLAGDAAHITPPFAGQGLVAGLRDAANLCWKLAWVLKGRADPRILASYDQERRPHARKMIAMALLMGRLVMPRNLTVALATHGLMRLIRLVPPLRRHFEELGIKPKNRFPNGLFVAGRGSARLRRGAVLPQGWVRGDDGSFRLSDEALGAGLTLIGFGLDPYAAMSPEMAARFTAAGGSIVQMAHRGQRLHLSPRGWWEDLEGAFLPGVVPFGWAAIVRPDRVVLHDGPAEDIDHMVSQSLALLGTPFHVAATSPGDAEC